jgi:alkyl sulfatase BDS1-like metallo-beta-lactamase superfamily hydrolase
MRRISMEYELNSKQKEATEYTREYNRKQKENMNPIYIDEEKRDVKELESHLIYVLGEENVTDNQGNVIWNRQSQNFLRKEAPDTVNPYLWQVAQDGLPAGIVELVKGKIYATTGVTAAPINFIRSDNGWVILEAGGSVNEAEFSLNLIEKALGENVRDNIKALIISHTHQDHFGGAEVFKKQKNSADIPVYGPSGYEQSLVNDNLYGGIAMSRRLQYQCGLFLQRNEKGYITLGLTTAPGVHGRVSTVLPTELISEDTTLNIDGVEVDFLLTPDTETEAHLVCYFKDYHALFLADNAVGTIHNTYTMRGAPVRDANYWGKILYRLYLKYGEEVEVIFAGHGTPHWKSKQRPDKLKNFLLDNAAAYKFTNDQALLYANEGYNMNEIGNKIEIPDSIGRTWYTRGHYGSYSFNARASYQKYLGFYDGNPVNLLPLPEEELAEKFIEYVGSAENVLKKAKEDYERGQYQWVATVTNHLVFANPDNLEARYLCADALEQLAYQSENGLWRNAYLSATVELRNPNFANGLNIRAMDNRDTVAYVSTELLLDHLGINFDGYKLEKDVATNGNLSNSDVETKLIPTEYKNGKLQFVLEIVNEGSKEILEKHIVNIYKGTIFHWQLDINKETYNDESEYDKLPIVQTTRDGVYKLAVKQYKENKQLFNTHRPDILDLIDRYVVDTSEFKNFNLIEPLKEK